MKRNYTYPDTTPGSKLAAKVRTAASSLKETERERLLAEGMKLIYGDTATKKTLRTGR
jgi:hypothetical protein